MKQVTVEAVKKQQRTWLEALFLETQFQFRGPFSLWLRLGLALLTGVAFFGMSFIAREVPGSVGALFPVATRVGSTIAGALFGYFFPQIINRLSSVGPLSVLALFWVGRGVANALLPEFPGSRQVAIGAGAVVVWLIAPMLARLIRKFAGVSTTYRSA